MPLGAVAKKDWDEDMRGIAQAVRFMGAVLRSLRVSLEGIYLGGRHSTPTPMPCSFAQIDRAAAATSVPSQKYIDIVV